MIRSRPSSTLQPLSLRLSVPALLCRTFHVNHVFSEDAVGRDHGLFWLIWPEDGCASIA